MSNNEIPQIPENRQEGDSAITEKPKSHTAPENNFTIPIEGANIHHRLKTKIGNLLDQAQAYQSLNMDTQAQKIYDQVKNIQYEKEPVPQINEKNGVSEDYWNEFNLLHGNLEFLLEDELDLSDETDKRAVKDAIFRTLGKFRGDVESTIKQYTEKYPEYLFENVVNENNKPAIERLNKKVTELYDLFAQKTESTDEQTLTLSIDNFQDPGQQQALSEALDITNEIRKILDGENIAKNQAEKRAA